MLLTCERSFKTKRLSTQFRAKYWFLPVLLVSALTLSEWRCMPATDTLTHITTVCRASAPRHDESSSVTVRNHTGCPCYLGSQYSNSVTATLSDRITGCDWWWRGNQPDNMGCLEWKRCYHWSLVYNRLSYTSKFFNTSGKWQICASIHCTRLQWSPDSGGHMRVTWSNYVHMPSNLMDVW